MIDKDIFNLRRHFKTWLYFLLILTQPAYSQIYCESGSHSDAYLWVDALIINDFFHNSGTYNGYIYGDHDVIYQGYKDYSHMTVEVGSEQNVFSITMGQSFTGMEVYWSVWIDLNQDLIFSENEKLISQQGLGALNMPFDLSQYEINEPLTTRMRVSVTFLEEPLPCEPLMYFGEVEDYTVTITPPEPAEPNTLRVPEQYSTIQSAVDAAEENDIILVNDGTYIESITITKPLKLKSVNGSSLTKVQGSISKMNFHVSSPDVIIEGFGLTGAYGYQYAGIYFAPGAHRGKAIDNSCYKIPSVQRNDYGVKIDGADNILVNGLHCDGVNSSYAGIWVENSINSHLSNNNLSNHYRHGIYLNQVSDMVIENNILNNNVEAGLFINNSSNLSITSNHIFDNGENGVLPTDNEGLGISIFSSNGMIIENNHCENNTLVGLSIIDSYDMNVTNNQFLNNHVKDLNFWDSHQSSIENNILKASNSHLSIGLNATYSSQLDIKQNEFKFYDKYALDLDYTDLNQVSKNYFYRNKNSLNLRKSDENIIKGNVFDFYIYHSPTCQVRLTQSNQNQLYLNEFHISTDKVGCTNESVNTWHSTNEIDYEFNGEIYTGQIGNYYRDEILTDSDGNGVAETSVTIVPDEYIDHYPLTELIDSFEIIE